MLSSRSLTALILATTLLVVTGCDRESPDQAQPGSAGETAQSAIGAGEKSSAGKDDEFTGKVDTSHRGAQMPDLTFTDPAGKTLRLSDLKGKPVLVNLWATWCGPCVLEMPMLDDLAVSHEAQLRVLTVSQDMEGAKKVGPFFAEKGFRKLEPWMDTANDLGFHYNTGMLPTTVLYDAQGREVWRVIGAYDWAGEEAKALVAQASAK